MLSCMHVPWVMGPVYGFGRSGRSKNLGSNKRFLFFELSTTPFRLYLFVWTLHVQDVGK